MANMNVVVLVGRLSVDPESETTKNGTFVSKFRLAVTRYFGEQEKTSFIPIVTFGNTAAAVADHCFKGQRVGVEGVLEVDEWDDEDNQRRYFTKVIANRVQFLSWRDDDEDDAGEQVAKAARANKARGRTSAGSRSRSRAAK